MAPGRGPVWSAVRADRRAAVRCIAAAAALSGAAARFATRAGLVGPPPRRTIKVRAAVGTAPFARPRRRRTSQNGT